MLEKLFESHDKWINTTLKFGCTRHEAEDIVSHMYLLIGTMLNKGLNISYGDDINYYYIYKTLRSSFLLLQNRKTKENATSINLVLDLASGEYVNYSEAHETIHTELEKLHWYDQKVYNMIQDEYSITELSKKTNITYHSLYNTFRKVKDRLKEKLNK